MNNSFILRDTSSPVNHRTRPSRLQAAGLVETRHGVGTFVLPDNRQAAHPLDFSTVVTIRDVLAMLELRISLETEAAGLAALDEIEAKNIGCEYGEYGA